MSNAILTEAPAVDPTAPASAPVSTETTQAAAPAGAGDPTSTLGSEATEQTAIETCNQQLTEAKAHVTTTQTALAAAETAVAEAQTAVDSAQARMTDDLDLTNAPRELDLYIESVNGEHKVLSYNGDFEITANGALVDHCNTFTSTTRKAQLAYNNALGQLKERQEALNGASKDLETANTDRDALQAQLATANATVTQLEAKLTGLQQAAEEAEKPETSEESWMVSTIMFVPRLLWNIASWTWELICCAWDDADVSEEVSSAAADGTAPAATEESGEEAPVAAAPEDSETTPAAAENRNDLAAGVSGSSSSSQTESDSDDEGEAFA